MRAGWKWTRMLKNAKNMKISLFEIFPVTVFWHVVCVCVCVFRNFMFGPASQHNSLESIKEWVTPETLKRNALSHYSNCQLHSAMRARAARYSEHGEFGLPRSHQNLSLAGLAVRWFRCDLADRTRIPSLGTPLSDIERISSLCFVIVWVRIAALPRSELNWLILV